ncbi:MAG: family 10 glycosylhydrolase [Candidatus Omnitrophota bacterium]
MGVWVTVFSPEKILYSKENADRLIASCKEAGIDHVYVQVYRAGKAYYDSRITDKAPYLKIQESSKTDILDYIIKKAKKNDIKIYAWINLLSLARNKDAFILLKFGDEVLTRDQYGRTPLVDNKKDELDKYFIRENQLFLEPGNEKVRKHLTEITEEIIRRYPGLDGLHLDYIRYPSVVPFAPGSRFTPPGVGYGYGKENIENFRKATGLDVKTMAGSRENFFKWDSWRRDQVTAMVREISDKVRKIAPDKEISCAIVPSVERTYQVNFQDWTRWLREKYVDWVVAMSYTDDPQQMKLYSRSMLLPQFEEKIYIGVGAFLLKGKAEIFKEELDSLKGMNPGGIVIFSYDDIAQDPELRKSLVH